MEPVLPLLTVVGGIWKQTEGQVGKEKNEDESIPKIHLSCRVSVAWLQSPECDPCVCLSNSPDPCVFLIYLLLQQREFHACTMREGAEDGQIMAFKKIFLMYLSERERI